MTDRYAVLRALTLPRSQGSAEHLRPLFIVYSPGRHSSSTALDPSHIIMPPSIKSGVRSRKARTPQTGPGNRGRQHNSVARGCVSHARPLSEGRFVSLQGVRRRRSDDDPLGPGPPPEQGRTL